MCEVVPCLVDLSFTFLVLVLKDDMLVLFQRYHVFALNLENIANKKWFHMIQLYQLAW